MRTIVRFETVNSMTFSPDKRIVREKLASREYPTTLQDIVLQARL
jgi:hypothetical protein